MNGWDALIKRLAKATGLSDDLAEAVIETAAEYVKAQRPDKAEQVDATLQDEAVAQKAGDLIARLGKQYPAQSEEK